MRIWYVDKINKSQESWSNYYEFKRLIKGINPFDILIRNFTFDKDEKKVLKDHHLKVKELYYGLEKMIEKDKEDKSPNILQADTIIYRSPVLPKIKDSPFKYLLGIDLCIGDNSEQLDILERMKEKNKLETTSWRPAHTSLVKRVEQVENPKEILDAVLEFNRICNELTLGELITAF